MKSAFEFFNQAAKCEQMAEEATDDADRKVLLAEATHWLLLGNEAAFKEATERRNSRSDQATKRPNSN